MPLLLKTASDLEEELQARNQKPSFPPRPVQTQGSLWPLGLCFLLWMVRIVLDMRTKEGGNERYRRSRGAVDTLGPWGVSPVEGPEVRCLRC